MNARNDPDRDLGTELVAVQGLDPGLGIGVHVHTDDDLAHVPVNESGVITEETKTGNPGRNREEEVVAAAARMSSQSKKRIVFELHLDWHLSNEFCRNVPLLTIIK